MKKNSGGRKKGSPNRLTPEVKSQLRELVMAKLEKALKGISSLDVEKIVPILIKCFPYFLSKGKVSNQETEVQQIVYIQLLRHYENFGTYLGHLSDDKKAIVLVQLLKMFTPQQLSNIVGIINRKR